jgi:CP family cyanate transporter-like MFS transporter
VTAPATRGESLLLIVGITLLGFNLRTASSSVPPVLPDLGLSPALAAALAASPAICFGLLAFAAPAVGNRLGIERGLFWSLVVVLVGLVGRSVWPPFGYLPGNLLAGFGVALMNVLLPILVRGRFRAHAGPVFAAYLGALTLGGGAAAALTVPLRHLLGGSVPLALAVWALPAAIALFVWLPQTRRARASLPIRRVSVAPLFANALAWQVTLFFGLQSLIYFGTLSWLPAMYRDRGLTPETAGLLLALMNTTGLLGNLFTPLIVGRLRDQRWVVLVVVLLTMAGLTGIVWGPTSGAVAWVVLLGLGGSGAFALGLLLIVFRSADADAAASLSSMTQGVGYLISACGPFIVGLLHGATGSWTLALGALLCLTVPELILGLGAGRDRVIPAGV